MADNKTNLELVRESVQQTQMAVLAPLWGTVGSSEADPSPSGPNIEHAYDQSTAKAVQSIGQTTAIVIQDAGDMLRNISTIEVTAIGAATAAWLATKDKRYKDIIDSSMKTLNDAAKTYLTIGKDAYQVLDQFKS
jgi:hypothetical protein